MTKARRNAMVRIQNILCPVDFFPASENAANYAIALAKKYGARLTLLHVVEPIARWAYELPVDTTELIKEMTGRSHVELKRVAKRAEAARVRVDALVRTGEVDLEVQSLIDERHIDFVVMGTHGRRGLEKLFMGSVTERLLRKLHVPLLTIGKVKTKGAPTDIRQILVTTDFMDGTADAVDYAFSIAKWSHAKVTLLHVLNDIDADVSGRYRDQLIRTIRQELDALIPPAFRHNGNVAVRIETGRPMRHLLPILKEDKIDLIVMNVHGKTLLDRITIGRTAENVVRSADIPVLVVPAMTPLKPKRRPSKKTA
jgi:nucleotide-binding universal stress UspA family protein